MPVIDVLCSCVWGGANYRPYGIQQRTLQETQRLHHSATSCRISCENRWGYGTNEWVDGWGWMIERMGWWVSEWVCAWMYEWVDWWMDEWIIMILFVMRSIHIRCSSAPFIRILTHTHSYTHTCPHAHTSKHECYNITHKWYIIIYRFSYPIRGSRSTVVVHWTTGQQVTQLIPHLMHDSYQNSSD